MFQRLHKQINPAMILAFVALVFALTGGAFAASGHGGGGTSHATLTATVAKKKPAPKSTRGPAGPKGATGATGPAGAAGATGATGPAGANGTNGVGTPGLEGREGKEGKEGKGKEGPKGTTGPEGQLCKTECVLPEGATETGTFSFSGAGSALTHVFTPISFPIPLPAALDGSAVHYINKNEEEIKYNPAVPAKWELVAASASCKGSVAKPEAEAGSLCVYEQQTAGLEMSNETTGPLLLLTGAGEVTTPTPGESGVGAGTAGAVLRFTVALEEVEPGKFVSAKDPYYGFGAWAVTAPKKS